MSKILDSKKSARALAALALALLSGRVSAGRQEDKLLTIINAGVEQSEDAPFVSSSFRFLPGDAVHFTFGISGFAIDSSNHGQVRKIALAYRVTAEDADGVPLAPAIAGKIETELNPEDKNWTPKRRVSFALPGFLLAGNFHIHVVVTDALAKTEVAKDYPFQVGGLTLPPAAAITLDLFQFLRKEDDEQGLEVAAYRPGDTVFVRFILAGFKTDAQNAYHLSYGVSVLRPDGKIYLQEPKAAELADKSFYPAQYLPGSLSVTTTAASARGQYVMTVTVHDLIAHADYQTKKVFSLE